MILPTADDLETTWMLAGLFNISEAEAVVLRVAAQRADFTKFSTQAEAIQKAALKIAVPTGVILVNITSLAFLNQVLSTPQALKLLGFIS